MAGDIGRRHSFTRRPQQVILSKRHYGVRLSLSVRSDEFKTRAL